MTEYIVWYSASRPYGAYVEVEANSPEEALALADQEIDDVEFDEHGRLEDIRARSVETEDGETVLNLEEETGAPA
jgi:hypothetical protein